MRLSSGSKLVLRRARDRARSAGGCDDLRRADVPRPARHPAVPPVAGRGAGRIHAPARVRAARRVLVAGAAVRARAAIGRSCGQARAAGRGSPWSAPSAARSRCSAPSRRGSSVSCSPIVESSSSATRPRGRCGGTAPCELGSGEVVQADRVVAGPQLRGQWITGVPASWWGFVPVDEGGQRRPTSRMCTPPAT